MSGGRGRLGQVPFSEEGSSSRETGPVAGAGEGAGRESTFAHVAFRVLPRSADGDVEEPCRSVNPTQMGDLARDILGVLCVLAIEALERTHSGENAQHWIVSWVTAFREHAKADLPVVRLGPSLLPSSSTVCKWMLTQPQQGKYGLAIGGTSDSMMR